MRSRGEDLQIAGVEVWRCGEQCSKPGREMMGRKTNLMLSGEHIIGLHLLFKLVKPVVKILITFRVS